MVSFFAIAIIVILVGFFALAAVFGFLIMMGVIGLPVAGIFKIFSKKS